MPNWCNNSMTIVGNVGKIKSELKKVKYGGLFEKLIGIQPDIDLEEYKKGGWYDSNINYWGTKWDVSTDDDSIMVFEHDINSVQFDFDTAWSPPLNFCKILSEKYECNVYIKFYEDGIGFAGEAEFENGVELYDNTYEFEEGIKLLFPEIQYEFDDDDNDDSND